MPNPAFQAGDIVQHCWYSGMRYEILGPIRHTGGLNLYQIKNIDPQLARDAFYAYSYNLKPEIDWSDLDYGEDPGA